MPRLTRGPAERELRRMIELFLKAETDIINEISRLRSRGLVDYHATAALERVQAILRELEDDCWTYAPRMIEMQFYVNHPEARKPLDVPETPEKHLRGYQNAFALTSTQTDIVQRLTMNLMGLVSEASQTTSRNLENMLIGRVESDPYRQVGLSQAAAMQATGQGAWRPVPGFVEALRREGITAFTDKAGRNWNLHTYGSMVLRTTSRQAEVLAVLTQDPEQDLYLISAHGSTCPLCAPLEGRVYSRSGRDPDFPSLAAAFGKMDPAGPDTLDNSWLNIHPNCLHQLIRWTPMGRSEEEIRKIKEFSSFEKNPVTRDPRTQKQVEAYRQKERDRARWLRDYRQWEKYREALGDRVPGTFETFRRHKLAGDEKFQAWKSAAKEVEKYSKVRYHDDGTVVVTDDWTKVDRPKINRVYKPNAVVDTLSQFGKQHDRTIYDTSGVMKLQIHGGDHGHPKQHPFGEHGEHLHDYLWSGQGKPEQPGREPTAEEKIQHKDILGGGDDDG